jgi:rubrerythrin
MPTMTNLEAAFAGESQANRKYMMFAKKADADGLPGVARLFRAAATAEIEHAQAHFKVMGGVKSTTENVEAAIAGEGHEFQHMYPDFIAEAKKEGNAAAERSFSYAMTVEKIHHALYTKALEAVKAGKDIAVAKYAVCDLCGNTIEGDAPDKCPICGATKFKVVT